MKGLAIRIVAFLTGSLFLGSWLFMDESLKGVVFFWSFPLFGLYLIISSIFSRNSGDDNKSS